MESQPLQEHAGRRAQRLLYVLTAVMIIIPVILLLWHLS
jgi:hypothetical protein